MYIFSICVSFQVNFRITLPNSIHHSQKKKNSSDTDYSKLSLNPVWESFYTSDSIIILYIAMTFSEALSSFFVFCFLKKILFIHPEMGRDLLWTDKRSSVQLPLTVHLYINNLSLSDLRVLTWRQVDEVSITVASSHFHPGSAGWKW